MIFDPPGERGAGLSLANAREVGRQES
jgi:hypothetical protein